MPELTFDPALIDLRNLAVALAAGFLIGFEREHTHVAEARARSFAGARTFSLAALAGGLCGQLDAGFLLAAVAAAVIGGLTIAAHWAVARTEPRSGGTTEIALLATYLLGVAAGRGEVLIAAAGAVAVTAMLSIKEIVQRWATALSEEELYAALRLLAISVIVLPALPDEAFGPYDALNPRSIWLLVVFISGLSFLGYWLMKLAGAGRGAVLTGVIGGLASSTATTLSLSRFVKDGADARDIAAGVITANVVMLIRVGFLLAAVSRQILSAVWPALLAGALAGAAAAWLLWRAAGGSSGEDRTIKLGNPMEIRPALFFAAILAAVSLASSFGAEQFGSAGLFIVGLISGLADVDAITLTAGRHAAGVGAAAAGAAVMAAVAANMVTKAAMAWSIGGRRLGSIVAGAFAAVIGVGAAVLFFI